MKDDVEIIGIRQMQLYDKDRGFFKVKEATFRVGNTEHTLNISMSDFNADKTEELVMIEAAKVTAPLGKKK